MRSRIIKLERRPARPRIIDKAQLTDFDWLRLDKLDKWLKFDDGNYSKLCRVVDAPRDRVAAILKQAEPRDEFEQIVFEIYGVIKNETR